MKYFLLRFGSLASVLLLGLSAFGFSGPTGTLYLMDYGEFGSSVGLDMVQGNSFNSAPTGNPVDICIAAYGDIRTYGYTPGDAGSRFSLAGAPLSGGPYVNSYGNQMHDGTSDGAFNYSVDYITGQVIQFDRSWASPVVLFTITNGTVGWITMNAADGSFWLSQYGGPDLVEHRSHTGSLLGSFNSGVLGSQGLALDPLDGTLWMSQGANLYQFSQSGTLLQSGMPGSANMQWYGMEFDTTPVPEPGCLSTVIAGAVLSICVKRYRLCGSGEGK